MTNNVRNWIHYIDLRTTEGTQLEHRQIAEEIKEIFKKEFPAIAEAKGWLISE
jgi:thymidylate synthase (FAD)